MQLVILMCPECLLVDSYRQHQNESCDLLPWLCVPTGSHSCISSLGAHAVTYTGHTRAFLGGQPLTAYVICHLSYYRSHSEFDPETQ